jgi:uncharacterized protein YciI
MKYMPFLILAFLSLEISAQSKVYTLVFLHKKSDAEVLPKEKIDSLMKGHMANINRLASEGKLLAAGPFDGGGGLFILNTTNKDEAQQWLSTDPGVRAKRWNIELLPYKPRTGGVCPVGEPYEMVSYQFVRFDAVVSKFNASTHVDIIRKHDEYVRSIVTTGNVVTEAVFGDTDGGILIVKGDLQKEVIEADPGVQEGLLEVVYKTLWIAKGSFCEK